MSFTATTRHRRGLADGDLVPMINVVFLLLIFFMVAGRIAVREPGLELPRATAGDAPEPRALRLVLGPDGSLRLDGAMLPVPRATSLRRALARAGAGAGTAVTLHVHRTLPAASLDPVLEALEHRGVARLQLVTDRVP